MMEVRHLQLAHGVRILCQDVSFTTAPGELLLLVGPNGSGKTTLLKALSAEGVGSEIVASRPLPPTLSAGPSLLWSRGWLQISDPTPSAGHCVLIPTGIPKVKGFTVEEFIRTGCYRESNWAGKLKGEVEERMETVLDLMGLGERRGQDIATLSDGEFQKACIAVGLTRRAEVLLLDEPTAYLDVENRVMVLRTLASVVSETGTTILFSSHDIHDATRIAHRVLALTGDGSFLVSGPENKAEVVRAAFPLLGENF